MKKSDSNRPDYPDFRLVEGLLYAAALSIPVWGCIGVAVAVMVQDGPISGLQIALLFFAVAAELVLLGRSWRHDLRRSRVGSHAPNAGAAVAVLRLSRLKPLLLLSGLTVTYLHYHFWDVNLQIVAMPSITVFVHAPALG